MVDFSLPLFRDFCLFVLKSVKLLENVPKFTKTNELTLARFLLYIILFFCWSGATAGQIDSLRKLAAKEKSVPKKTMLLYEISDQWSYTDSSKAIAYLNEAKKLAEGDKFLEALALFYEAGIYFDFDMQKSQSLYMKCARLLNRFDTPKANEYKARLWHNYGTLDQIGGDDKSFLEITLKYCIPYASKSLNKGLLSAYLSDVGMIFYNHKAYEKSVDYYRQAIDVLTDVDDHKETLAHTYVNLAQSQIYQTDLNGARASLNKAQALLGALPEAKITAVFYMAKSMYHRAVNEPDSSLASINMGIRHAKAINAEYDLMRLQYERYQLYRLQTNYTAAKRELETILSNDKFVGLTKNRLAFLIELANTERDLNNYKRAYELLEEHRVLNDSVHAENIRSQIAHLETQYRTSEKEKEILTLQNKRKTEYILLVSSVVFIVLLSCLFIYALKQRKKRNQQHVLSLEREREIEVSKALMDGEEQERLRIARDLHDGLGGMITGIKMKLDSKARLTNDSDLLKTVEQLDTVLADLRRTARNLIPENLMKYGLEDALKDFCQSINTSETQISFYCNDLSGITDKNTQLILYHVMLELVNNAIRHAEATNILLQCTLEGDLLLIDVEDNGKGFDMQTTKRNMGLNNIEMRVKYLDGKMNIDSRPGKGTTTTIECHI